MSEAFVKIDLHGLRQEEAIKVIDKAIAAAGPTTYHLQLIHEYNRGTSLRSMIYDWYKYDPKVKRNIILKTPEKGSTQHADLQRNRAAQKSAAAQTG